MAKKKQWQDHVFPHGDIERLAPNCWQVSGSLPRNPVARNMTLWRQPQGNVVVHSAVCLDEPAMQTLDALGPVSHIVVPCPIHRSDAPRYKERYPQAKLVAPACCREAVEKVVPVDATCEASSNELGVEIYVPEGLKAFELHYLLPLADGGKALVVTDALFNLGANPPQGLSGRVLNWMGSVGPLGITKIGRWLLLQDKEKYRGYLNCLADIDGLSLLLVAHGRPVTGDVSGALRAAAGRV